MQLPPEVPNIDFVNRTKGQGLEVTADGRPTEALHAPSTIPSVDETSRLHWRWQNGPGERTKPANPNKWGCGLELRKGFQCGITD